MYLSDCKYLGSIIKDLVIMCDEIINNADVALINNTITVSTNLYNKKVRYKMDYYILHIVLLVIILLLVITIICYHLKRRTKKVLLHQQYKNGK